MDQVFITHAPYTVLVLLPFCCIYGISVFWGGLEGLSGFHRALKILGFVFSLAGCGIATYSALVLPSQATDRSNNINNLPTDGQWIVVLFQQGFSGRDPLWQRILLGLGYALAGLLLFGLLLGAGLFILSFIVDIWDRQMDRLSLGKLNPFKAVLPYSVMSLEGIGFLIGCMLGIMLPDAGICIFSMCYLVLMLDIYLTAFEKRRRKLASS